ncbi:lipoprotein [Mycoplasmopsis californica]|uniref:hypothetical protein n=1 Tax=Mycoplasmopsis californica TaxID=2113 RepID=UPI000EB619CC|nr:hypothetical protein [Mycoplasmopsis californica]BBG40867.1 lipoprotein [Mycoplasmopsis californica]BBG41461.1 lipoprotein [Mycoplasmopsis californica]BBG42054.1 lipoprotein [Mycoplasmopsis californica]
MKKSKLLLNVSSAISVIAPAFFVIACQKKYDPSKPDSNKNAENSNSHQNKIGNIQNEKKITEGNTPKENQSSKVGKIANKKSESQTSKTPIVDNNNNNNIKHIQENNSKTTPQSPRIHVAPQTMPKNDSHSNSKVNNPKKSEEIPKTELKKDENISNNTEFTPETDDITGEKLTFKDFQEAKKNYEKFYNSLKEMRDTLYQLKTNKKDNINQDIEIDDEEIAELKKIEQKITSFNNQISSIPTKEEYEKAIKNIINYLKELDKEYNDGEEIEDKNIYEVQSVKQKFDTYKQDKKTIIEIKIKASNPAIISSIKKDLSSITVDYKGKYIANKLHPGTKAEQTLKINDISVNNDEITLKTTMDLKINEEWHIKSINLVATNDTKIYIDKIEENKARILNKVRISDYSLEKPNVKIKFEVTDPKLIEGKYYSVYVTPVENKLWEGPYKIHIPQNLSNGQLEFQLGISENWEGEWENTIWAILEGEVYSNTFKQQVRENTLIEPAKFKFSNNKIEKTIRNDFSFLK